MSAARRAATGKYSDYRIDEAPDFPASPPFGHLRLFTPQQMDDNLLSQKALTPGGPVVPVRIVGIIRYLYFSDDLDGQGLLIPSPALLERYPKTFAVLPTWRRSTHWSGAHLFLRRYRGSSPNSGTSGCCRWCWAGFWRWLAIGAVGHALATAVRRRRNDLAVLRALGSPMLADQGASSRV